MKLTFESSQSLQYCAALSWGSRQYCSIAYVRQSSISNYLILLCSKRYCFVVQTMTSYYTVLVHIPSVVSEKCFALQSFIFVYLCIQSTAEYEVVVPVLLVLQSTIKEFVLQSFVLCYRVPLWTRKGGSSGTRIEKWWQLPTCALPRIKSDNSYKFARPRKHIPAKNLNSKISRNIWSNTDEMSIRYRWDTCSAATDGIPIPMRCRWDIDNISILMMYRWDTDAAATDEAAMTR